MSNLRHQIPGGGTLIPTLSARVSLLKIEIIFVPSRMSSFLTKCIGAYLNYMHYLREPTVINLSGFNKKEQNPCCFNVTNAPYKKLIEWVVMWSLKFKV